LDEGLGLEGGSLIAQPEEVRAASCFVNGHEKGRECAAFLRVSTGVADCLITSGRRVLARNT